MLPSPWYHALGERLGILAGLRLLPESSGAAYVLCSTDEPPHTSKEEIFSELQPQHLESHPTALGLVLYGLPHQAIV